MKKSGQNLDVDQALYGMVKAGLVINNDRFARRVLQELSAFHLQEYGRLFYNRKQKKYERGTTFEEVYQVYRADRFCKNFLFDFLAEIEVQVRMVLAQVHQEAYGNFGYLKAENFDLPQYHAAFLNDIRQEADRGNEPFVSHAKRAYGENFPLYIAVELLTFGDLAQLYRNFLPKEKDRVALFYGMDDSEALYSYIHSLTFIRNTCAHHGRLSNRSFPDPCSILEEDRKKMEDEDPGFTIDPRGLFANILAMCHLLEQRKAAALIENFDKLFRSYPDFSPDWMGFPPSWKKVLLSINQDIDPDGQEEES